MHNVVHVSVLSLLRELQDIGVFVQTDTCIHTNTHTDTTDYRKPLGLRLLRHNDTAHLTLSVMRQSEICSLHSCIYSCKTIIVMDDVCK